MWLKAGTPVAADAIRGVGFGDGAWGDAPGAEPAATADGAGAPWPVGAAAGLAWAVAAGTAVAAATGGRVDAAAGGRLVPTPVGAPAGARPEARPRRP